MSAGIFSQRQIGSIPWIFPASKLTAQDAHFHNAPTLSNQLKNPYARQHVSRCGGRKAVYDELRVVAWNQRTRHREWNRRAVPEQVPAALF
jgi:hypothetical protein